MSPVGVAGGAGAAAALPSMTGTFKPARTACGMLGA
jgi:hypothetical protein